MNNLTKLSSKNDDLLYRYFDEIRDLPVLKKEEELLLITNAQSGDRDACNILLLCNLKFVVLIAKQYRNRGAYFEDIISEGNLGLFDAITRFDTSLGVRFSSYAVWWIRNSIGKFIYAHQDIVRSPANIHHDVARINRKFKDVEKQESAKLFDKQIETAKLKEKLSKTATSVTYLNNRFGNGGVNCIADESFMPDLNINIADNNWKIANLLSQLDKRTHSIIVRYFGIVDGPFKSLEDIATEDGVSRETVRRIRDQGLNKLRELLMESANNSYICPK